MTRASENCELCLRPINRVYPFARNLRWSPPICEAKLRVPPSRKTLRAPRIAAHSPLTHCRTRARASAAPNDARTQAKKQVVSQDDFQAKANHRARAPRPARRRWRRSVRAGVYVGRASRLRRRASASRAAHRFSYARSPPPPPPSSTEAPTAAPTVPGWCATA